MKVDDAIVRSSLDGKETEELVELRDAGTLTPGAMRMVNQILDSREDTVSASPPLLPHRMDSNSGGVLQYLTEHFRGSRPLWSAFWLIGVTGFLSTLTIAWFLLRVRLGRAGSPIAFVAVIGQMALWVVYLAEAATSIWRCAYNTNWRGWGHLARGFLVLLVVAPVLLGGLALLLE